MTPTKMFPEVGSTKVLLYSVPHLPIIFSCPIGQLNRASV
jgi:hypothetical protein